MDVTCERCGTEYEFDETLVSDRGTTVKCTNCGHLFKVFRPEPGAGPKSWQIEQRDGTLRTLGSLKELQRLIKSGVLSPDDRISRDGEAWKRLGDIAELQSFFEAAATVVAGAPPTPAASDDGRETPHDERPLARTLDGVVPPSPPPGPRKSKDTIMGVGAVAPVGVPPARTAATAATGAPDDTAPSPPRADSTPAHADPAPTHAESSTPTRRAAPPRRVAAPPTASPSSADTTVPAKPAARAGAKEEPLRAASAPSEPPRPSAPSEPSEPPRRSGRGLYLDEQEPAAPPRTRSRSGLWVALVVLLAAGVGVALGWPQIAPVLGLARPVNRVLPHVDAGDRALSLDHISGYESAVHHYTQALAYDDHDPRVLTSLSRAHALWAQALLFDASDLEARADEDPARRGEAAAIRREVQRHAETALQRAEDAVRHGAGDADAEVALADALRLTGDLTRARSRLDRALTLRREGSAEALRVQALLDAAAAGGDLAAAQARAEQAVAEDPGMLRARLVYARALLAARDVGSARQQIDAVLRRDAHHPAALALRAAIDEGRPPAPPTIEVPDAGSDGAAAPTPAAANTPAAADGPAATAPSPASSSRATEDARGAAAGPIPSGRDYSWYVRNGDEQRQRGDLERARAFYEAALRVRASGSEALTGLGYADLQSGNVQSAADRFRQAAGRGYAEAYIGLGDAYRRLGRLQDALTAYERYLERLPGGPHAAIAHQNAAALRSQLAAQAPSPEPAAEPQPAPEPVRAAPPQEPPEAAPDEPAPSPPASDERLPAPSGADAPPPQDVPALEPDDSESAP